MAVSYLSKPIESSPYIPPVDLNLMAKVLSFKQSQFDATASKVQSQIDTIASTDLMRGVDRDYTNGKLNNIVENLNSLGGVDLADYNIGNQINGYATSIYNDDKVITAISSTKRARALMSSYDKMKSDPKLMKYYSEANEYSDNKSLNAWMQGGEAGQSYSGPSAATRYTDYNADFQKTFKDLKARKQVDLVVDGFYINKTSKESYTEADIMKEARDLLTPIQREQMQRDGVFLYEHKLGYGKDALVEKAIQGKVQDLEQNTYMISSLKNAIALEHDPKSLSLLKATLKDKQTYVNALTAEIPQSKNIYGGIYDSNPDELMYKVYSDDYFRGLGNRYAQYSENREVTTNQPALQSYLQDRMDNRQNKELNAARTLNEERMQNAKEIEMMKLAAEGKAEIDPATGKYKLKDAGGASTQDLYTLRPNQQPDLNDVEEHYLPTAVQRIADIDTEVNQKKEDYLSDLLSQNVDAQNLLKDMSYDFNGDHKVTLADFQGEHDGMLAYSLIKDPVAQRLVATALKAFDDLSEGKPIAIDKFPEGTSQLVEQLRILDAEKQAVSKQVSDYKMLGKNTFEIPNYSDKIFSSDEKTQNSKAMSLAKSFLIKTHNMNIKPSDISILSVGKKDDNTGYKVTVQKSNGKTGKNKSYEEIDYDINNAVAKMFNIEEGDYSGINNVVTGIGEDFYAPIQNVYDDKFVSKIRVYKNGNTNSYSAQYGKFNPATNSVDYVAFPSAVLGSRTNRFPSAAQAYAFGKNVISNFGKELPPDKKKNLKEIFENKLNGE